jgi:hypothetical protein
MEGSHSTTFSNSFLSSEVFAVKHVEGGAESPLEASAFACP